MDAKTAFIVDGRRPNNMNRIITTIRTIILLGFSLNSLLLCYLAMLVGNNKSATTKNAGKLLAISIAMQMRWCGVGRIAQ
jgi:hypothetical protein